MLILKKKKSILEKEKQIKLKLRRKKLINIRAEININQNLGVFGRSKSDKPLFRLIREEKKENIDIFNTDITVLIRLTLFFFSIKTMFLS